jgi:hypothetical protein
MRTPATTAATIGVLLVLAACAPPMPPPPPPSVATEAAVLRERLDTARAEAMGGAFALTNRAQQCPSARLRGDAARLNLRLGAYYRALRAADARRADTFEAHARSMVVQLPPGAPTPRLCASIEASLPDTERVMRDAGI